MRSRILLLLAFALFAGITPVYGNAMMSVRAERETDRERLSLVQKIYVGDMGSADEADRFRMLLEEQLSKKGFTIVDSAERADAILSGALSVRVFDKKSEARAFVRLTTHGGESIWARDFGNKIFFNPFHRAEPVKRRAEDIAKRLREDWKKSGGK
ncbi:MAG TPA: hypothetical protein VM911_15795 [Pyrinomonadaceae bacterium]|nr:hypothetical protein [Pyrinomonadaceae bacterium]